MQQPDDATTPAEAADAAVEPEPPSEPADATPTPLAAPSEGPVSAATHGGTGSPRPVASKVTPVLVVVAVGWVLKKLLSRR